MKAHIFLRKTWRNASKQKRTKDLFQKALSKAIEEAFLDHWTGDDVKITPQDITFSSEPQIQKGEVGYRLKITLRDRIDQWQDMDTRRKKIRGIIENEIREFTDRDWGIEIIPTPPFGIGRVVEPISLPVSIQPYTAFPGKDLASLKRLTIKDGFLYFGHWNMLFEEVPGAFFAQNFKLV